MIVQNSRKSLRYWSAIEKRFIDDFDVFSYLTPVISLDAHISNAALERYDLKRYRPILAEIYPIPPRTTWKFIDDQFEFQNNNAIFPKQNNEEKNSEMPFFDIAKKYFRNMGRFPVALELSGGLDSTLALVAMFDAGFRPTLIGGRWFNYESRTERIIQDIIIKKYNLPVHMFDNLFYPFHNMREAPRHLLPNPSSFYWSGHNYNSELCVRLGIGAIVGGHGGDALLCDPLEQSDAGFTFKPWAWGLEWAQDFIYAPNNVRYLSAFGLKSVAQRVAEIRYNAGSATAHDRFKILFRELFSDRIPTELSKFHYKASGTALHLEGLYRAEEQLLEIYRAAKDVYGDKRLDGNSLKDGIQKYSFMSSKEIKDFEAVISFACWIWSNLKIK